jgi:putative hydrolase of the HAD superfamily
MLYQAILFDLDDTLYDYRAYWQAKLRHALGEIVGAFPALALEALMADAIERTIYAESMPAWLAGHGVADAALVARAQERYRANWWHRLALHAEAGPLLEALRARYRLGLITNGPARTQRPKIAQFRLDTIMDAILISGELGLAKPEPAIFRLALEALEVAPHEALYVGDSLLYDLPGAHAAGLDFVWVNPRAEPLPPDLPRPRATIRRLDELRALLLHEESGPLQSRSKAG